MIHGFNTVINMLYHDPVQCVSRLYIICLIPVRSVLCLAGLSNRVYVGRWRVPIVNTVMLDTHEWRCLYYVIGTGLACNYVGY